MRRSLALLFTPLFSPRAGFRRFLAAHGEVDPASLPLFSVLLLHFAALAVYARILRWRGADGIAGVPAEAAGSLTAAVPFVGSLWMLTAVLVWGLILWGAGSVLRRRRPYGEWVGLAAICLLPEVLRVLVDGARVAAGAGGTLGRLPVDPFVLWEAVLAAFGFAAYAEQPWGVGAAVGAVFVIVQHLLTLSA